MGLRGLGVSVLFVTACLLVCRALADPVQWAKNQHYYERVDAAVTWHEAEKAARSRSWHGLPGHLATITSKEESEFIIANAGGERLSTHCLGGFKVASTGAWRWVTGEAWRYTSWSPGEPNNFNGIECVLEYKWAQTVGTWNDCTDTEPTSGYVVEYEPALGGQSAVLEDTFSSGAVSSFWRVAEHGGRIVSRSGELALLPPQKQTGFPWMVSRDGALPVDGHWRISVRVRFPHRGPYGTGVYIRERGSSHSPQSPLWMHFDRNVQGPIFIGLGKRIDVGHPQDWHDAVAEYSPGYMTVSLDGKAIGSGACPFTD